MNTVNEKGSFSINPREQVALPSTELSLGKDLLSGAAMATGVVGTMSAYHNTDWQGLSESVQETVSNAVELGGRHLDTALETTSAAITVVDQGIVNAAREAVNMGGSAAESLLTSAEAHLGISPEIELAANGVIDNALTHSGSLLEAAQNLVGDGIFAGIALGTGAGALGVAAVLAGKYAVRKGFKWHMKKKEKGVVSSSSNNVVSIGNSHADVMAEKNARGIGRQEPYGEGRVIGLYERKEEGQQGRRDDELSRAA